MSLTDAEIATVLNSLSSDEWMVVKNLGTDQRDAYLLYREAFGYSHREALDWAYQDHPGVGFPAIRTDSEFNKGRCNGNQFERVPGLGDHLRKIAERNGVSTTGKYYCHGLAEYPGDPAAWISGRGDVVAVARAKGMKVHGSVEYTPEEREPMRDVEIADDLVAAEVDHVMRQNRGYAREEVEENVRTLRTGAIDLNPELVEA